MRVHEISFLSYESRRDFIFIQLGVHAISFSFAIDPGRFHIYSHDVPQDFTFISYGSVRNFYLYMNESRRDFLFISMRIHEISFLFISPQYFIFVLMGVHEISFLFIWMPTRFEFDSYESLRDLIFI